MLYIQDENLSLNNFNDSFSSYMSKFLFFVKNYVYIKPIIQQS